MPVPARQQSHRERDFRGAMRDCDVLLDDLVSWCLLGLQGSLVAVFGVPDMGPACSEKHVPSYIKNVGMLNAHDRQRFYGMHHTLHHVAVICDRRTS